MMPPTLRRNDRIVVVGGSGSGKSTFLSQLSHGFSRVIIYDALGQHGKLGAITHDFQNVTGNVIVFQPRINNEAHIELAAKYAMRIGNVMLMVEEADLTQSPYYCPPTLYEVANTGRNYGVGLTVLSRRFGRLNNNVKALADHLFIFNTWFKADVDALAEYAPEDVIAEAASLTPGSYLYTRPGNVDKTVLRGRTVLSP